MYLRNGHVEKSIPVLRQLIKDYPLGVLTTAIPSKTYPTILSTHIPFVLDVSDDASETELGVLRAHLARPNPQSKAMSEALVEKGKGNGEWLDEEVLVMFTSQVQHYVTPKFYTETKPVSGKVVPTWNYAAAQVYGRARIWYDSKDPATGAFLAKQIRALSQHAEEKVMGFDGEAGRQEAWTVDEAPQKYIELLQKGIIGIEIHIERLEGKFKMSQEMGVGDRAGVAKGFAGLGGEVPSAMSKIVAERGGVEMP